MDLLLTSMQNFQGQDEAGFLALVFSILRVSFNITGYEFRWPSSSCSVQKPHTTRFHKIQLECFCKSLYMERCWLQWKEQSHFSRPIIIRGFRLGPEIGYLKYLQILILSANNISGLIPLEFGNCSMHENMLSGVLPSSIGNCTKLEELYLHDNRLSGSLPETLSEIKGLRILDATSNRFAGEISFSFENCKLEIFILSFNNIKGEIPSWLGNCKSLQQLAFVSNSLSGTIPTSLGLLSNLHTSFSFSELPVWANPT